MHDLVTTLHYPLRPSWTARALTLTEDSPTPVELVRRLISCAAEARVMVLDGFGRADRFAAGIIARRRNPPRVIMTDCTWRSGRSGLDRAVRRLGVRALDGPHMRFCVLSEDESRRFPRTWGVDAGHVRVCHWYHGLSEAELALDPSEDGPIFTGGDSLRDYRALLAVAPELPFPIRMASSPESVSALGPLAPNIAVGRVPHAEYVDLMRRARAVVLPLEDRADRSAGQQTYLTAMALGKTLIVTDTVGVRDYVEHGRTALVVPPNDPRALRDAVLWSQDEANRPAVREMQARAKAEVRSRFRPEDYVERLLTLVDEPA